MRPLTHQVWEQHYVELRPHVLERWPEVNRSELQSINEDYDGLLALLQRATGMSADLARLELTKLDVEEFGLGTGEEEADDQTDHASLDRLFLGKGFQESERDRIVDRLSQLNRHLRRFPADATALDLVVKDRDTTSQVVTLELDVPGLPRFVAKSHEPQLRDALADVRHDLIQQIESTVGKRNRGER